jgi:hypothetical protein
MILFDEQIVADATFQDLKPVRWQRLHDGQNDG